MQALLEHPVVAPVASFLAAHVVVVPLLVLLAVASVVLAGPVSRRLGSGRFAAALLLLACTAPFALTLPPSARDVGPDAVRRCLTVLRPVEQWGRGGEELANVLLMVPAGLLLVLLLPRARVAVGLLLAAGAPLLVEGVQYALPALGRLCEVTDVALNLLGLAVGVGLGLPLRALRRRRRRGAGGT